MSDSEILAASFKLSDAQELVARQAGFASWQALKAGASSMTHPSRATTATRPVLSGAEPQLFVTNIKASCDFFTGKLGFEIAFVYGEPPFYAQVKRDAARLNLRCVGAAVIDPALRDRESLLSAAITVENAHEIKQLYLDLERAGVPFAQSLKQQPWGAKDFIVQDPDGNLIL